MTAPVYVRIHDGKWKILEVDLANHIVLQGVAAADKAEAAILLNNNGDGMYLLPRYLYGQ